MNWQSVGHVDYMLRILDLYARPRLARALLDRATTTVTGVNGSADAANDVACHALSTFLASDIHVELSRLNSCLAGQADVLVVEDPPRSSGSGGGRFVKLLKAHAATLPAVQKSAGQSEDGRLSRRRGKIRQWRRFSVGTRDGAHWPRSCSEVHGDSGTDASLGGRGDGSTGYGAVVVRLQGGGNQEALRMTAAAAASVMRSGAPLVVCGTRAEGVLGAATASTLTPYFHTCRVAPATRHLADGGAILLATRRSELPADGASGGVGGCKGRGCAGLVTWARDVTLELPGPTLSDVMTLPRTPCTKRAWRVFPGLFAGGGLDIMTAALLQALPLMSPVNCPDAADASGDWVRKPRVMDFCCGSGTIAAALCSRQPGTATVSALDADAVALQAAKYNLGDAVVTTLSDGWANVDQMESFDWIVSNPPLHRGSVHDFTVCLELIKGAAMRLTPGGSLWIVTQNHVPLGPLLDGGCRGSTPDQGAHGTDKGVDIGTRWAQTVKLVSDGRFAVWRAVKAFGNHTRAQAQKRKGTGSQGKAASCARKKLKTDKKRTAVSGEGTLRGDITLHGLPTKRAKKASENSEGATAQRHSVARIPTQALAEELSRRARGRGSGP